MANNFYASYGGSGGGSGSPTFTKVSYTYADFAVAATTKTVTVATLPLTAIYGGLGLAVKTAFAGSGDVSHLSMVVSGPGAIGNITSLDGTQPAGIIGYNVPTGIAFDLTSTTPISLTLSTDNGDLLNTLSAGALDIYYYTLNVTAG